MGENNRKLKIAEFVTIQVSFPIPSDFPRVYAPLEIALAVAGGLSRRGHEIVFFGPRGSASSTFKAFDVDVVPLYKNEILEGLTRGIEREKIFSLFDQYIVSSIFEEHQKRPFDILHIHPIDRVLPFARLFRDTHIVYTLHDPIFPWRAEVFRMFASPNQHLVSISNAQRSPAPDLNYLATIYNGIAVDDIPFSDKGKGEYLLFMGRLHAEKGVAEAVEVALKAGEKLIIAGPPVTDEHWDTKVKPYLGEQIKYIGVVRGEERYEYYRNAKATLVPIQWEEPFGMVMIESMVCGTPVIAFRRGSVPDIVVHGKTGFIVDTVEEMVQVVKNRIGEISRKECRDHVRENFDIERMINGYEEHFLSLARGIRS